MIPEFKKGGIVSKETLKELLCDKGHEPIEYYYNPEKFPMTNELTIEEQLSKLKSGVRKKK